jgi:hypothetical protein
VGKYTLPVNGTVFFVFFSTAADGSTQSTSQLPPRLHLSTSIKIPPQNETKNLIVKRYHHAKVIVDEKQLHKYDNDEIIEHKLTSIFISTRDDDCQEMIP